MIPTEPRPVLPLAGGAIDRAPQLREPEQASAARARASSRTVVVRGGQEVLLSETGALARLPISAVPEDAALTLLGLEHQVALFAYDAGGSARDAAGPAGDAGGPGGSAGDAGGGYGAGTGFASLREVAAGLDTQDGAIAAYAVALAAWHRSHGHCARCGAQTVIEQAGHFRRCPNCGAHHFPRTDPVVTMLVQDGERSLLTRRHGAPANRWSALAGFVEPGE